MQGEPSREIVKGVVKWKSNPAIRFGSREGRAE